MHQKYLLLSWLADLCSLTSSRSLSWTVYFTRTSLRECVGWRSSVYSKVEGKVILAYEPLPRVGSHRHSPSRCNRHGFLTLWLYHFPPSHSCLCAFSPWNSLPLLSVYWIPLHLSQSHSGFTFCGDDVPDPLRQNYSCSLPSAWLALCAFLHAAHNIVIWNKFYSLRILVFKGQIAFNRIN